MTALPSTRRAAAATLAGVLLSALPADAAVPAPLPTALSVRGGRLLAGLDLAAAFPPQIERTFGNGLTNVVTLHLSVVPEGEGPTVVTGRVIEILFDVWEETYVVTVKDPRAPAGVRTVLPNFPALRAFLAWPRDVDLGPSSAIPRGPFAIEARLEVNPVSKELLERTREFIANPSAGARPGGGSRSILGAMASFLLREPETGADVRVFRSRPIGPGEVTAR